MSTEQCDTEVFELGVSLGFFELTKDQAEAYCKAETERTGRKHDWHYVGGRVHVKALPAAQAPQPSALAAALACIEALERERDAALRSRDDWIRENGPGGWIDALRNLAKARATANETLMRALEIIAVGDSNDPAADAKESLIEAGCWAQEQTT